MHVATTNDDISPIRMNNDSMDLDVIMEHTHFERPPRPNRKGDGEVMINSLLVQSRVEYNRWQAGQSLHDGSTNDAHDTTEEMVAGSSTHTIPSRSRERSATLPAAGQFDAQGGRLAVAETRTGRKRELSGGSTTRRDHSPHGQERDDRRKKRKTQDKGKGKEKAKDKGKGKVSPFLKPPISTDQQENVGL
jgi:hypothetical protein